MWKLHQLMGALEINVPLDRVEARAEEHNRLSSGHAGAVAVGRAVHRIPRRCRRGARAPSCAATRLAGRATIPLTGLLNRSQFEHSLGYLARPRPKRRTATHAIMFLDLDQFKS